MIKSYHLRAHSLLYVANCSAPFTFLNKAGAAIQDQFWRINYTACVTLFDVSKRIHCLLQQGNLEAVGVSPNLMSSEGLGV